MLKSTLVAAALVVLPGLADAGRFVCSFQCVSETSLTGQHKHTGGRNKAAAFTAAAGLRPGLAAVTWAKRRPRRRQSLPPVKTAPLQQSPPQPCRRGAGLSCSA